jgi:hypothetical protein
VRTRAQRAKDPQRVLPGFDWGDFSEHTRSISWDTRSARDCRGKSLAVSSSTSSRQPAVNRASGDGGKCGAGACTCIRTRPSRTWRGSSIRSSRAGSLLGRFYRLVLIKVFRWINAWLVRWAQCQHKRLRRYPGQSARFLVDVFGRQPGSSPTGDSVRAQPKHPPGSSNAGHSGSHQKARLRCASSAISKKAGSTRIQKSARSGFARHRPSPHLLELAVTMCSIRGRSQAPAALRARACGSPRAGRVRAVPRT